MREATLAHPAIGRLRNDHQVWTPSIFPMTERWLSVWQQSGLDLETAMVAAAATSTAIIGFVEQELIQSSTVVPDEVMLASFPNARFAFATERDGAKEFELVVRSLINGVHASLLPAGTGVPSTPPTRRTTRTATRAPAPSGTRSRSRRPA
jgi:hypothetical protein